MSVIAVVDAGSADLACYAEQFARLRRTARAERVFVLMDGDLNRAGGLAERDKYERAEALLCAGADCVVEMPIPTQTLPDNLYAFSVVAMLRKLGCIDQLALPTTDPDALARTAAWLFDEPAPYRSRMRELRDGGADLDAVYPEVGGGFVPGAAEFLAVRENRMSVEYFNTLRRSYSTVKPLVFAGGIYAPAEPAAPSRRDDYLLQAIAGSFLSCPERDSVARAAEMFSGSERMARRIYRLLSARPSGGFEAFSRAAACADMNPVSVRRYLMGCLLGYRKVDGFVCITYNYIPYIRVLGARPDALAVLRGSAGTTLVVDTLREKDESQVTDVYKRMLLSLDARARRHFLESEQTGVAP